MADDKLNTNPQENTPPDVAALLGSDAPPEHEQAVISGMGEEAPAPAGTLPHPICKPEYKLLAISFLRLRAFTLTSPMVLSQEGDSRKQQKKTP